MVHRTSSVSIKLSPIPIAYLALILALTQSDASVKQFEGQLANFMLLPARSLMDQLHSEQCVMTQVILCPLFANRGAHLAKKQFKPLHNLDLLQAGGADILSLSQPHETVHKWLRSKLEDKLVRCLTLCFVH